MRDAHRFNPSALMAGSPRNPRERQSVPRFERRVGKLLRLAILLSALLLLSAARPADPIQLSVTTQSKGTLHLRGSFEVNASTRAAWEVLTDYGRLAEIVSSIETSRVLSRQGHQVRLFQEAEGRVLLFSRRLKVLLEIEEQPMRAIAFQDVLGTDFQLYRGGWKIQSCPGGVRVGHEVMARPQSAVPHAIIAEVFKATARDLLEQVRAEILMRAQALNTRMPASR